MIKMLRAKGNSNILSKMINIKNYKLINNIQSSAYLIDEGDVCKRSRPNIALHIQRAKHHL